MCSILRYDTVQSGTLAIHGHYLLLLFGLFHLQKKFFFEKHRVSVHSCASLSG